MCTSACAPSRNTASVSIRVRPTCSAGGTFAEKLRGWGIEAEATRQATRGAIRNYALIWRVKTSRATEKSGDGLMRSQGFALEAWAQIIEGLSQSESAEDRALAVRVDRFVRTTPFAVDHMRKRDKAREPHLTRPVQEVQCVATQARSGPEIGR